MPRWAIVGPGGHCEGVVTTDGDDAEHGQALASGQRAVLVTDAEAPALRTLGHHALLAGNRWLVLPPSHARKTDRARGIRADIAADGVRIRERNLEAIASAGGLVALERPDEEDSRLPDPGPALWREPLRPFGELGFLGRYIDVGVAGLIVRHMTEPEVSNLSEIMLGSGAYDGYSLEECWTLAHTWYTDPNVWPLALDWNGRVLQYEMIHFDDLKPLSTARGGFVTRVDKDRPTWFWREVSKAVFETLLALGYSKMSGHVRSDRKDWADALVATYGGECLGLIGGWWTNSYPLAEMIARCQGWPARRAAGGPIVADGLVTRDAGPSDFPKIVTEIRKAFPDPDRAAYRLRLLNERWNLDNAAVGVTMDSVSGDVVQVRVVRDRTPTEATAAGLLIRQTDDRKTAMAMRHGFLWMQALGYGTVAYFTEDYKAAHPMMALQRQRQLAVERNRFERDATTFIEYGADINAALAQPVEAWTAPLILGG